MMILALNRANSIDFPLLLHVLGAMLLIGTLLVVALTLLAAWRRRDADEGTRLTRFGLKALLMGVVPSYVLMRIGAQWTESEQNLSEEAAWLGIGYITADIGAILILISIVLAAIGLRRLRNGSGSGLARAVGVISVLLLAAYVVAVWAMTAKPD